MPVFEDSDPKSYGDDVYGRHNEGAGRYAWDYPGGWTIESCKYASSLNGPTEVWVRGYGEFHHGITNTDIYQNAKFGGDWADRWSYACWTSRDNPPGTYWGCDGDRERLD